MITRQMVMREATCPQCGERFMRARKSHIYCSKTCNDKAKYERYKQEHGRLKCENCGKEFDSYNLNKRFCSTECKREWLSKHNSEGGLYKLTCIVCGKEYESAWKHQKYCSRECKEAVRDINMGRNVQPTCIWCGSSNVGGFNEYCSKECKDAGSKAKWELKMMARGKYDTSELAPVKKTLKRTKETVYLIHAWHLQGDDVLKLALTYSVPITEIERVLAGEFDNELTKEQLFHLRKIKEEWEYEGRNCTDVPIGAGAM